MTSVSEDVLKMWPFWISPDGSVFVAQGLPSSFDIDNAQSAVHEADGFLHMVAFTVRPPMNHDVTHPF